MFHPWFSVYVYHSSMELPKVDKPFSSKSTFASCIDNFRLLISIQHFHSENAIKNSSFISFSSNFSAIHIHITTSGAGL